VIGDPPFEVGTLGSTENPPLSAVIREIPGADETPIGIVETGVDASEVPEAFMACTVALYKAPLTSPVKTHERALVVEHDVDTLEVPTACESRTV